MIILYELNFIVFQQKFYKQEKEALTSFILSPHSRNTIGWFMKTHLFRLIKIL